MKKFVLVLAFIMLFFCNSFAHAEEKPTTYTSGDYEYIVLEDGTAEITAYADNDIAPIVPSELGGYTVTSIGEFAFDYCIKLEKITLPNSVTSIGKSAFYLSIKLEEIIIPDSVTYIGDMAFDSCGKLKEITIPDSVTAIGINPFTGCTELSKINVSANHPTLEIIDGVLFDKVEKRLVCYPATLTTEMYEIPNGITSIGDWAFHNFFDCDVLTEVIIPDSVTSIGDFAFCYCDTLKKINIPDSVTFIGDKAFMSCHALKEITIPDSVTAVGMNPFTFCTELSKINVSANHPTLEVIDGVLFDKVEKKLICYPETLIVETYEIPNGILSIGESAFDGCDAFTEVIIPDSVTSIGESAFDGNDSLTMIVGRYSCAEKYAKEEGIWYAFSASKD